MLPKPQDSPTAGHWFVEGRQEHRRQIVYGLTVLLGLFTVMALPLKNAFAYERIVHGPQEGRPDLPNAPLASGTQTLTEGDTHVDFDANLSTISFKLEDGYELDQYLCGTGNAIDFEMDLHGYSAHPSDPSQLSMRVWDVDQDGSGNPEHGVEIDKVYINGTYIGDLTGANEQYSVVSFDVPAGVLNTGINEFRVDIDTGGFDSWCVTVDFVELLLPFNVAQTEASATNDVPIKREKSDTIIEDPIWKTSFDANGKVITPANPDDPIADKIQGGSGGFGARQFEYQYTLETWPAGATPTWTPQVKYNWEIVGTAINSGSSLEQEGWTNSFPVTIPDKIGKYELRINLAVYQDSMWLTTEERTHVLYVLWDTPRNNLATIDTRTPKTAWLDIATLWAEGAQNAGEILAQLNASEYGSGSNPLGWEYGYPTESPLTLIETTEDGINGDCYVFRDVWRMLAGTLGISTLKTSYWASPGYLTSDRSALDGNNSANAHPLSEESSPKRWFFSNHQYGLYGSTFYDPTFGLIGSNTNETKEQSLYCKINSRSLYYLNCPLLKDTTRKAEIYSTSNKINGWPIVEYKETNNSLAASPPVARSSTGTGVFTGTYNESGYDDDENDLYEHLEVRIELDVTEEGSFNFIAALESSAGDLITQGSLEPDIEDSRIVTNTDLPAGTQELAFYFNGRSLRTFGEDGPYTLTISMFDDEKTLLDTMEITTASYDFNEFQGNLMSLVTITDEGVDTDSTPGYNVLRASLDVETFTEGSFSVDAQLFAGDVFLGNTSQSFDLVAGLHTVELDFPGEPIGAGGVDGPYTIYLNMADHQYSDDEVYETRAYDHTAFQTPSAYFTGTIIDQGIDSDNNALFDTLDIEVEAVAIESGSFSLNAILQDANGTFIESVTSPLSLDTTPVAIDISFQGINIHRNGVDGPYEVVLAITDEEGNDINSVNHLSGAYLYTDFEAPEAGMNGTFDDVGIDTNSDGYYDVLRITVGIEVLIPGEFTLVGSLHAENGDFITGALSSATLDTGPLSMDLDFEGLDISASFIDGPYRLGSLELFNAEGESIHLMVDTYTTAAYGYAEFQPAGIQLTGVFDDYAVDEDGNGLYDILVVDVEAYLGADATYSVNARLVNAQGEEIVWTSLSQYFAGGIHSLSLEFDGRYIYGNGENGPYTVKDLSIYSSQETFSQATVYTTGAYDWDAFEPSAVISGTVINNDAGVNGANVLIAGLNGDVTNSDGEYRLTPVESGTYTVELDADERLAPWQITVDGVVIGLGTSVEVQAVLGTTTTVNFLSAADEDGDGYSDADGDCNDLDTNVHPAAVELCNGIDDNCDTQIDEGFDLDEDGHFSSDDCIAIDGDDCDDSNPEIYGGADERCDGIDNDCDEAVDEDFDQDEDGHYSADDCSETGGDDCDDSNPFIHPDAEELCDLLDNDCDLLIDEDFDLDGDGWLSMETCPSYGEDCDDSDADINPDAVEVPDGIDNDCDGQIDEPDGCSSSRRSGNNAIPATLTLLGLTFFRRRRSLPSPGLPD